jgi:type III restriction enzyme
VKNHQIGFEIAYSFKGIIHKFRSRLSSSAHQRQNADFEVKGQSDQQQQTKREFLSEWVRAVNWHGGFGEWTADVSGHPKDLLEILTRQNA